jgi:predicted nucleic acid-binding protein
MRIQGIDEAILWSKEIIENEFCNIFYCNKQIFLQSIEIFRKEKKERKSLTLTDCVVYVSQKLLSCDEILTFDLKLRNYFQA